MKVAEIALEYQPLIPAAPVPTGRLHEQACSNDKGTVEHWKPQWLEQIRKNKETFGSFMEKSVAKFYGLHKCGAAIIAGSGPSLKWNAHELKNRGDIPLISCLHNFHRFEDLDLAPEFYVTLDAGDITIEEVTEGGAKDEEWYWERTKERKLIAFIGTHPKLLEKWRGEIYFYNAPVPDQDYIAKLDEIERFNLYFSNGGNVLGSCLYLARGILGATTIVFVGADFSFSYGSLKDGEIKHTFHSWDSKYDKKMGVTVRVTDVYGNKVKSWPSYMNFKAYFDWFASHVGGYYINATEGGCLGAYPDGNIAQFKYMDLKDALAELLLYKNIEECVLNPEVEYRKILY